MSIIIERESLCVTQRQTETYTINYANDVKVFPFEPIGSGAI